MSNSLIRDSLQNFIEYNIGRNFHNGGEYRYGGIILYTRYFHDGCIVVGMEIPCIDIFEKVLDTKKDDVKDNVDFYRWLKEVFFEDFSKNLPKLIKNK